MVILPFKADASVSTPLSTGGGAGMLWAAKGGLSMWTLRATWALFF
jgi:hypothetical protein